MPPLDPTLVYDPENSQSEPVSPEHPLLPIERQVLAVWKQERPSLAKAHADPKQRHKLETMVRLAVDEMIGMYQQLRADGMTVEQAMEIAQPPMWTPPPPPNQRTRPSPTRKAKRPVTTASPR